MTNKLQLYFPMIRSRKEVLNDIYEKKELADMFFGWEEKYQEEFLDFCTGVKGVKMLYDFCAKALLDPEIYPERLEEFISLLLETEVKILKVLPNDNSRIADESSLLLMDIVVQLKDGSIANVEIQKIGYAFPGQRSACYSADLLLRQYKSVRRQMTKDTFSYKHIQNVYTIVLFEKSTREFHEFPDHYIHKFHQQSDTGLELELLQKFVFVPLDMYQKNHHNKTIKTRLDAWLTFLSSDDPGDIIVLIEKFPDFKSMYEQVYEICQNIERVMGMFSKELREMDRNTVRYMIDEMQNAIDQQKEEIDQQKEEIDQQKKEIVQAKEELAFQTEKNILQKQELEQKELALQEALRRIEELEKRNE